MRCVLVSTAQPFSAKCRSCAGLPDDSESLKLRHYTSAQVKAGTVWATGVYFRLGARRPSRKGSGARRVSGDWRRPLPGRSDSIVWLLYARPRRRPDAACVCSNRHKRCALWQIPSQSVYCCRLRPISVTDISAGAESQLSGGRVPVLESKANCGMRRLARTPVVSGGLAR